jgi:hypothetical protein
MCCAVARLQPLLEVVADYKRLSVVLKPESTVVVME